MSVDTEKNYKILLSAGEVSGDKHAALVVEELKSLHPNTHFKAMGGRDLRAQGVTTIIDSEVYGGKNGFQIISILFGSLYAFFIMAKTIVRWRPDLLIVVDYPDFNMRLAFIAKIFGVPVLYHIPPKVWAWRSSRIKRIKKSVSSVACIFPFEPDFYKQRGFDAAHFVGHPFNNELPTSFDKKLKKQEFCKKYNLDPQQPVLAIFPGSRKTEVARHLPILTETLNMLRQKIPGLQTIIVRAPSINPKQFAIFDEDPQTLILTEAQIEVMQAADVGLLKSGTCNLEAAYCKLPFVCMYTTPRISAWLIRKLVQLKEYSLVNIIRSGTIKEVMQEDATPDNLAKELLQLIDDTAELARVNAGMSEVVELLAPTDDESNRTTVELAQDLLNRPVRTKISKRLVTYIKPYRSHFYISLLCMVLFGASDGIIPFLVKHILDGVFSEQNQQLLYVLPAVLIVFAFVRAVVDVGQHFFLSRIGHNIVRDIRNQTNDHLLKLSPGYFFHHSSGNLLARFTSDVVLVRELLTNSISSLIRDVIRIIALLITALFLDPLLGLIAFVVFPIGIFPVYRFGKRMRKLSKRGQEAIGTLSAMVQQSIIGNKVVKIFGREQFEHERFQEENERLNRTFIKSELVRAVTGPVNEILSIGAISAVILYGGMSVINGTRTQGDFIAFLLALFLLYDPFKKLSKLNNQIQQGISGAERIFELLDTKPSISSPSKTTPMTTDYSIQFSNVSFAYSGTENSVLKDIRLQIPQNTKLALVGFSGAGKSTLVDLIPRFIDPCSGSVRIGGLDVRDLDLGELRSKIAMVDQHTFLFHDTVFNNIAYGKQNTSKEEVIQAAKAAHAYEFIQKLPKGFDSIVGESGFTLSGGERQRIAIARAILKDAPILILDEATASLDNKSEHLVQAALETLERDRTTLVIAHRLSTVRNADCIIVLEDGVIVETGTHDELLAQGGAFARLYELQFRSEAKPDLGSAIIN